MTEDELFTVVLSCKHSKQVRIPVDFDAGGKQFCTTTCLEGCGERLIIQVLPRLQGDEDKPPWE